MAPMYYRNANAALLIFDIANYNTFIDVKIWVTELQKYKFRCYLFCIPEINEIVLIHRNVQEPMILTLIGNKTDLSEKRAVSRDEAFLFASSINGNYLETSTVTEQGIEQVFMTTALGLLRLAENRTYGTSIKRYESVESISTYCSSLGKFMDFSFRFSKSFLRTDSFCCRFVREPTKQFQCCPFGYCCRRERRSDWWCRTTRNTIVEH